MKQKGLQPAAVFLHFQKQRNPKVLSHLRLL